MADAENETCLGDVVGNSLAEETTWEKSLKGIEKIGEKLSKENARTRGWMIVASTLLQAKISHIESVNVLSSRMRGNITKK